MSADAPAVRAQDGVEPAVAGVVGAATGFVAVAADIPALAAVAGGLALVAGLLGRRAVRAGERAEAADAAADALRVTELTEELSLARLREQALQQRIELLEHAARAAAAANAASYGVLAPEGATTAAAAGVAGDGPDLLTDDTTGLFSEAYFEVALETRIAAARRRLRPVALVLLDVVQGVATGATGPADVELVARALRNTLREADTACRLDDGRFALVLEDTPENGAIWTVERLRTDLAEHGPVHTVWAGIACYPAHAFDKGEILTAADEALRQARAWRQDRIEVATAE